jgi:anti-anti-sigma factor
MEISTRSVGNALVVALEGQLDAYWAGETERELWSQLDQGYHWLVIDLAALTYLSSGGLRSLLRVHRRLADLGGKLALAAPQPYVRNVLDISGLTHAISIYDTVPEALAAVAGGQPVADIGWAGAHEHQTAYGRYRVLAGAGGMGGLRVVGSVDDLLYSRATPDLLTSLTLAEVGYGLAVGATAESAAAAVERLGELLALPGAIFWLPGDGRQTPDFLTGDLSGARLPVYWLNGLLLQGPPQFYVRCAAMDVEAGIALADLAHDLLGVAAQQVQGAAPQAIGIALRGDLAAMWGVGLKRAPCAGRAPANGREISHRENIADWLHFPTEATFPGHAILGAGVIAAATSVGHPVAGCEWASIFGAPERLERPALRMHLHAAAFRPVPDLGGTSTLDEESRHVATQGELVGVAHLLPNTRLRSALLGVWTF